MNRKRNMFYDKPREVFKWDTIALVTTFTGVSVIKIIEYQYPGLTGLNNIPVTDNDFYTFGAVAIVGAAFAVNDIKNRVLNRLERPRSALT